MFKKISAMKKLLLLTAVLSWINLLICGFFALCGLIGLFASPAALAALFIIVLSGAVILHSYAAMQLRRSIIYPSIPLSSQTPSGIRIMGFMALFFAIMSFANAIIFIQQAPELAKQVKLPAEAKNLDVVSILRGSGIFTLIISLSILTNVVLNFRLLKWYMIYESEKENNEKDNQE
jgi:hypothetical protein